MTKLEIIKKFARDNGFRLYFFQKFILVDHDQYGTFRVPNLDHYYNVARLIIESENILND